jgi:phosphopantothenoylcysteine decarboxylase
MDSTQTNLLLKGREIVLGVCAGIACYKVADLCSKIVQQGAGVSVVMTPDATKFVGPLTFQALTGRPVRIDIFELSSLGDPKHISMTEKADLMLIAPATANTIAKLAHGICDDLVALMACAAACPVVLAPAMNNRMWSNAITQENIAKLKAAGHRFIGPEDGWLACRNTGPGRLTEAEQIAAEIASLVLGSASRTT